MGVAVDLDGGDGLVLIELKSTRWDRIRPHRVMPISATDAADMRNSSAYSDWVRDFDRLVLGYTDWQDKMRSLGASQ